MSRSIHNIVSDDGEITYQSVREIWSRWQDDRGYKFYHNRRAKTAMTIPLPDILTWAERGQLNELANYLVDGALVYRGNGNHVCAMDTEDMARVLGVSLRTAQGVVRHSIDSDVMARATMSHGRANGLMCYLLNPLYFSVSDWIPITLYLAFKAQIDEYLPRWAVEKYSALPLANGGN